MRSSHLLAALINKPNLLATDAVWPLLSISTTQLSRLLPLLDAQSEERPELQTGLQHPQHHSEHYPERQPTPNAESASGQPNASGVSPMQEAHLAVLNKFTLDVTEKARSGGIDPVFGRDMEIRQMVDILSRRRKITRFWWANPAWVKPRWWKA